MTQIYPLIQNSSRDTLKDPKQPRITHWFDSPNLTTPNPLIRPTRLLGLTTRNRVTKDQFLKQPDTILNVLEPLKGDHTTPKRAEPQPTPAPPNPTRLIGLIGQVRRGTQAQVWWGVHETEAVVWEGVSTSLRHHSMVFTNFLAVVLDCYLHSPICRLNTWGYST